jgi:cytochrome oxidase Cu insertion factor (SCO1/SenC/PrrC family)
MITWVAVSTRRIGLGIGVAIVALVGVWLAASSLTQRGAPRATGGGATVVAGSLDGLLMDLQIVPLDGQAPKPFALDTLDGRRMTLADLSGRPALLYFWASW